MEGKERGTSMPLQTGCLSAVCVFYDPHLAHVSIANPHRALWKSLCSVVHLWASLNWAKDSQQQAVSVALTWLKWVADTCTCALTMPDESTAWRQNLSCLSENPPLLSAEVNKRPNKMGVNAIQSFFGKWSLIAPFFLVDQSRFWRWQSTYPQFQS